MTRFRCFALLVTLASAGTCSAFADTLYNFSFSGNSFSGSGVFDTVSTGSGEYRISAVSGSVDTGNGMSRAIDDVLAKGSFEMNDNLLFFPAQNGAFFDGGGVSFSLVNGAEVNLYSSNGAYLMRKNSDLESEVATITVAPAPSSPVPEPDTLSLMGAGVLMLAGLVKRRSRA